MSDNLPTDYYKEQTEKYDKFSSESFSWAYIEKIAFNRYLKDLYKKKNLRVLDVGSGTGKVIEFLISKGIKPSNIIGIDSSQEMVKIARKKLPSIKFILADISKVKVDEKFDLITANMTLQHLDQMGLKRTMKNFFSWLIKGGILFYILPHPTRMMHDRLNEYLDRKEMLFGSPWNTKIHYFHRPVSDYINETIKAGFTINVIDEPQPIEEGKRHVNEWEKYTSFPSRLVVKATKLLRS